MQKLLVTRDREYYRICCPLALSTSSCSSAEWAHVDQVRILIQKMDRNFYEKFTNAEERYSFD